jgi:putative hydrolase of the HAD superfamily
MIKAIIFDFGRVISAPKPASLFRGYEEELGLSPGVLNRVMFGSAAWEEVLVGSKTSDQYWREIGPRVGLHTPDAISEFRRRYRADERINEGVLELMRRLHGHYKLAVLSNAPAGLSDWLADWQMTDLFEYVFCSAEEGVAKPDALSFQRVLDRLGVGPHEAVFIDDTLGHVEAARSLGLYGLLFTTPERLVAELDELLAESGEGAKSPSADPG